MSGSSFDVYVWARVVRVCKRGLKRKRRKANGNKGGGAIERQGRGVGWRVE